VGQRNDLPRLNITQGRSHRNRGRAIVRAGATVCSTVFVCDDCGLAALNCAYANSGSIDKLGICFITWPAFAVHLTAIAEHSDAGDHCALMPAADQRFSTPSPLDTPGRLRTAGKIGLSNSILGLACHGRLRLRRLECSWAFPETLTFVGSDLHVSRRKRTWRHQCCIIGATMPQPGLMAKFM